MKFTIQLHIISLGLLLNLCPSYLQAASASTEETQQTVLTPPDQDIPTYRFHRGGLSDGRMPYEEALLKLLMQTSFQKFGPAHLEFSDDRMSSRRALKEIKRGVDLHFQTGASAVEDPNDDYAFILRTPIMNNLLGYRQLIVRRDRLHEFQSIDSWQLLTAQIAGQASQWPDTEVLNANNVPVVTGLNYNRLFPMLKRERFDYLPLGISEISGSLDAQKSENNWSSDIPAADDLVIVDNIVLYYPWPMYLFVGRNSPKLAERFEYSFDQIKKNGKYIGLINRYFAEELQRVNKQSTKVFILHNPKFAPEDPISLPALLDKATIITRPEV